MQGSLKSGYGYGVDVPTALNVVLGWSESWSLQQCDYGIVGTPRSRDSVSVSVFIVNSASVRWCLDGFGSRSGVGQVRWLVTMELKFE